MSRFVSGIAAGAVGTLAIEAVTYLDMLIRGRSPSEVPARVASNIAHMAGFELGTEKARSHARSGEEDKQAEEKVKNRASALGALLGFGTGLTVGGAYGVLSPSADSIQALLVVGSGVGVAAMALSDVPAVALGVTNPKEWGTSGWLADIVPHLAYGFVTALAYERFRAK